MFFLDVMKAGLVVPNKRFLKLSNKLNFKRIIPLTDCGIANRWNKNIHSIY